ncbi:hypothetical protein Sbal183_0931 [Shewanella baltica OS183]|uniref:hypothetical protein n=1 Tax=Shewanella baltica TaxID=62322 RepID=UPI0001E10874|nr:hypothetical protein [Shewanella baltica]AEG12600.1 hypothetical protein Sbal175_3366 [Shewanella baltica BA175]EHQ13858.1 hypothetical protein Sbal183_0931 [Shewanella baltica OS183]
MTLSISRLKIIAKTIDGDYGVDIPFEKGLFILRLDNSHGKSTCINAIAYALGMEKALGLGSSKLPFPPSLTKALEGKDGTEYSIIKSSVMLEIGNKAGNICTLSRQIVGSDEEGIIYQYDSRIDNLNLNNHSKLFLHREGDTTRPLGFFKWLDSFVGWNLPLVPNFDGKEVPLYPSIFFPTWFVEQKKGWSSIQSTTPTFMKIKEAKKRALEFILNLDVNDTVKKRAKLKVDIDSELQTWKAVHKKSEILAARVFGQIRGVADTPEAKFDQYKIDISIKKDERWLSIQDIAEDTEKQLLEFQIKSKIESENSQFDNDIQCKIDSFESEIRNLDSRYVSLDSEISFINQQVYSTNIRVDNLLSDQRKYEDLKKIGELKIFANTKLNHENCPTCGQDYTDNLIDMDSGSSVMSVDESLDFIKQQVQAFKSVAENYKFQKKKKTVELGNIKLALVEARKSLRKIRESIHHPEIILKEEELRQKIKLENSVESYSETISSLVNIRLEFDSIFRKYSSLTKQRRNLPESILSPLDMKKISILELHLRKLLVDYGFSSFSPDKLEISRETYLPTREGFDIGFDTSASDGIRLIWSYLLSLFKLSNDIETNHPKLVVFDEPRQQEANKFSFTTLLKSASEICIGGGQVILATSEESSVIKESLQGVAYTMFSSEKSEGKIIRKLHG